MKKMSSLKKMKKTMTKKISLARKAFLLSFPFLLPAFSGALLAEEEEGVEERREITEEIEVVKPYQPSIQDFRKEAIEPDEATEIPRTEFPEIDVVSTLQAAKDIKAPSPAIDPAPVRDPVLDHLFDHYVRLAAGNYRNITGEYHFNSTRSRKNHYSGYVKHNSGSGPLEHSGVGLKEVSLTGKRIFNRNSLQANLEGSHNIYHYYGDGLGDIVDDNDSIQQRYNKFGGDVTWRSINDHNRIWKYRLNTGYNFFSNDDDVTNHHLGTEGEIALDLDRIDLRLSGSHHWDAYSQESEDIAIDTSMDNHLIKLKPHATLNSEVMDLRLGLNLARDQVGEESEFYLHPDFFFSYGIAGDFLHLYTGLTGQVKHHSHASHAEENPFFSRNFTNIRNTNEQFEIFGGAKGTFTNQTGFDLRVSYHNIEDKPFFRSIGTPLCQSQFDPVYDDGTTVLLKVDADLEYDLRERIQVFFGGTFQNYNLSSLDHAYHEPTLEGSLRGRFDITDELTVELETIAMDERYGTSGDEGEFDGFIDLNAGASYEISSHFSAFAEANNLLNNNYEIWHNYPVRGFHFQLGGTVQF